jgi:hypothetical protein
MKILFFLVPYNSPTNAFYHHNSVALSEGFEELGVTFFGNINYWYDLDLKEWLIKAKPKNYVADVHIYSSSYFRESPALLDSIDYGRVNVLIDMEDGLSTSAVQSKYEKFDLILRSHFSRFINYPKNVVPWAFGLTNRIIHEVECGAKLTSKRSVLNTFRVPHMIRDLLCKSFQKSLRNEIPVIDFESDSLEIEEDDFVNENPSYWAQTGRRHNSKFYNELNRHRFAYAFGGNVAYLPDGREFNARLKRKLNTLYRKTLNLHSDNSGRSFFIYQFDSWRFWEALYSNSIPLQLDFLHWGFVLPTMPDPSTHYLGIKHLDCREAAQKVLNMSESDARRVSSSGKSWCLTNYGPRAVAERLIHMITTSQKD